MRVYKILKGEYAGRVALSWLWPPCPWRTVVLATPSYKAEFLWSAIWPEQHSWERDKYQQIDEIPKELMPHLLVPLRKACEFQKIEPAPEIIPEYAAHVALSINEKLQRARREINPVPIVFNIELPASWQLMWLPSFDQMYTIQRC